MILSQVQDSEGGHSKTQADNSSWMTYLDGWEHLDVIPR